MWEVENRTPFADDHTWVRDRNGSEVWLVAVRGTFLIHADGSTSIAEEQDEVCLAPKYNGEPGQSSLLYDTDLPHTKPTTDILLQGHAYSPNGQPAPQVDVRMQVANLQKSLRVIGDRVWEKTVLGVNMTPPEPFEMMPITYERAFGGADRTSDNPENHDWEERNPVGTGFAIAADHLIGQRAPNVEDPRNMISSWGSRPRPAGFGPIPPDWLPRRNWGGTYDKKWERERLPLLPNDFDDRFNLCAPEDQQARGYLKGGEPVELQNLTPDGTFRFELPRVSLGFETHFSTGKRVRHRPTLYTVIIEPDFPRVLMVWHTHLPCHPLVLKLEKTTVTQKTVLQSAGAARGYVNKGY